MAVAMSMSMSACVGAARPQVVAARRPPQTVQLGASRHQMQAVSKGRFCKDSTIFLSPLSFRKIWKAVEISGRHILNLKLL